MNYTNINKNSIKRTTLVKQPIIINHQLSIMRHPLQEGRDCEKLSTQMKEYILTKINHNCSN